VSEQPTAPPRGGHENVLTHKLGPLPTWAWVGVAAAVLVVWRTFSNKKTAAASQQQAAASTSNTATAADQVPQFVNQTYTTVTAPAAPAATTPTPTNSGTGGGQHSRPTNSYNWLDTLSTLGTPPHAPTTTNPAPRPPASIPSVTGLRVTGFGATNVGLAWNPVSGAQNYQVRVTYQSKVVNTAMTNGTSYNVTGLSPNRTYGLHVVAINGSDWAPETSVSQKTS
jgi:hypothetical protein